MNAVTGGDDLASPLFPEPVHGKNSRARPGQCGSQRPYHVALCRFGQVRADSRHSNESCSASPSTQAGSTFLACAVDMRASCLPKRSAGHAALDPARLLGDDDVGAIGQHATDMAAAPAAGRGGNDRAAYRSPGCRTIAYRARPLLPGRSRSPASVSATYVALTSAIGRNPSGVSISIRASRGMPLSAKARESSVWRPVGASGMPRQRGGGERTGNKRPADQLGAPRIPPACPAVLPEALPRAEFGLWITLGNPGAPGRIQIPNPQIRSLRNLQ